MCLNNKFVCMMFADSLQIVNVKSRTPFLVQISTSDYFNVPIRDIMLFDDDIFLFADRCYFQFNLLSKSVINKLDFPAFVLADNNRCLNAIKLLVMNCEQTFLIVHENSLLIYQNN